MLRNWLVIILFLLPVLGYAGKKNKSIECTSSGECFWECQIPSEVSGFDSYESGYENSNNSGAEDGEDLYGLNFGDLDFGDLDFGDLDFGDLGFSKRNKKKVVKVSIDKSQNNCCFYVFFDEVDDDDAMKIALFAYRTPHKNNTLIKSSDLGSEVVGSGSDVVMIYNQKENFKEDEVGSIYLCKVEYQLDQLNIIENDESSFVATLTPFKGFVCDECNKIFYKKETLSSHKTGYHTGEQTCHQCHPPVKLKSAQALATHNFSHHSGEQTCHQCHPPVKLKSAQALATHNFSHHSGEQTCHQCHPPVKLKSAQALATHNFRKHQKRKIDG